MVQAGNLGYPRFGAKRDLKRALEGYWSGKISESALREIGGQLRFTHWQTQHDAGIDIIPSNDFSFYDQMLDMTLMVGAIPARYAKLDQVNPLQTYFAMARGIQHDGFDIPAMEMTKWFDTNYHYIVPEIEQGQAFRIHSTKVVDEFLEAQQAGFDTRPVLIGPVTYLLLSKSTVADRHPLDALPALLPVYSELLQRLAEAGAAWVQIDEPCLVMDLDDAARAAYNTTFAQLSQVKGIRLGYYEAFLKTEIERTIRLQEQIGLDVLVHGEFERTDMVEYFGEQMTGIAFTQQGWVQSYGSRGVRPPVIYGDVARPAPMTVAWSAYAQSLTERPVKGMLTGPVTILEWSFVRDDQPRADTCQQIALAIRDEVVDLEQAGIRIIQIDEPALREGLPVRRADWAAYLRWAVDCFRLAASGVSDETQIHTHMCYAEFNDILDSIARMDADVISIEASRSKLELLDAFRQFAYPNGIGPGVYDIHSPRVPSAEEIDTLLARSAQVLPLTQLWVNPDCGLKTRGWDEVVPALERMVNAARKAREHIPESVNPLA